MIKKIEYENKEGLQNDATIPDKNKVTDDDMNEIKDVVNTNADELQLQQENQNNINQRVTTLETDNTTNKQNI